MFARPKGIGPEIGAAAKITTRLATSQSHFVAAFGRRILDRIIGEHGMLAEGACDRKRLFLIPPELMPQRPLPRINRKMRRFLMIGRFGLLHARDCRPPL